jgi:hypothetical protein
MKRHISLIIFLILSFFTSYKAVHAQDFSQRKTITIARTETIEENPYFAVGDIVQIDGVINGDVYIAGGELVLNGTINGDLYAAGGNVRIAGRVRDNVKVAGGQISLTGEVGDSFTAAGGNITIERSARVADYILVVGGNASIYGPVGGAAKIFVGNATIDSQIGNEVEAGVGMLRIGSQAVLEDGLTYISESEAAIDSSARISGDITRRTPPPTPDVRIPKEDLAGIATGMRLFAALISILTTTIIGFLLLKYAPNLMERTRKELNTNPWRALGIGLLTLFLVPLIFIFLLILVLTIPIAVFLMFVFGLLIYLAKIFVIFWLGRKLFTQSTHYVAFFLMLVIYVLVTLVPVIGWAASFVTLLLGLGVGIVTLRDIYREAAAKKIL